MYKYFFEEIPNIFLDININQENIPDFVFCTDTRKIIKNSWFIALEGKNFDGHDFCEAAIEAGATGLIISKNIKLNNNYLIKNKINVLKVKNTLITYQKIANYYRKQLKTKFIAITGSNGKTTTKELLYCILKEKYKTSCSLANENNEIGVPKNILNISPSTDFFISECGMRGLGEIKELVEIINPEYTVITNIGTAHIGILGSQEKIAEAKSEIFRFAPINSKHFLPFREPFLENFINNFSNKNNLYFFDKSLIKNIFLEDNFLHFNYKNYFYKINSLNISTVYNACLCINIALELGLKPEEIQKGILQYKQSKGRGEIIKLTNNNLIIDETYNASPESILCLIQSFEYISNKYQKTLILGEIAELGDYSFDLLIKLKENLLKNLNNIFLIGESNLNLAKELKPKALYFKNLEEIFLYFKQNNILKQNNNILAFKASRKAKLEELINKIIIL